SRSFEPGNIVDRNNAIMDMLYLVPAVLPDLAILSLVDPVLLTDGTQDCIIIIAVNTTGALAEVFPWRIKDDGEVEYIEEAALSPSATGAYSEVLAHMLPTFFTANNSPFYPSDLLAYLSEHGNEI